MFTLRFFTNPKNARDPETVGEVIASPSKSDVIKLTVEAKSYSMVDGKEVRVNDDAVSYLINGHDWFEFYAENETGKTIDHLVCDPSKGTIPNISTSGGSGALWEMDDIDPAPLGG